MRPRQALQSIALVSLAGEASGAKEAKAASFTQMHAR